jgi:ABC-type nitrate/sulfonate/bicarbonate transport systems, periplasmic components
MTNTVTKLALAGAMALTAFGADAADKLTLQLKWVTQAQFAGYFVAKDKGYYEAEGLDVEIKPGGPNIAPEQIIAGGGADVIVDWMGAALAAREKGVPLVNIAQPYKNAGLEIICPADSPIKKVEDFKGRTIGVWFYGNEVPFFALMNKYGLKTEGAADGVKVLQQSFDVQPLIQKQADCIHVMTYNELGQAYDAATRPTSSPSSPIPRWATTFWRTASTCWSPASRTPPSRTSSSASSVLQ